MTSRRLAAAVTTLCLAAGLSACSASAQDPSVAPTDAAQASSAAQAAKAAKASQAAAKVTKDANGAVGAIADLQKVECSADKKGNWSFTGSVTNGQAAEQKYTIDASVVDTHGFSVLGSKTLTVVVAPKATAKVASADFYRSTGKAAWQCVTRVVRVAA